jgi:hypothetical protein
MLLKIVLKCCRKFCYFFKTPHLKFKYGDCLKFKNGAQIWCFKAPIHNNSKQWQDHKQMLKVGVKSQEHFCLFILYLTPLTPYNEVRINLYSIFKT